MPSSHSRQRPLAFNQTLSNLQDRHHYVRVIKDKLPSKLKVSLEKAFEFDDDRYNLTAIQLLLIIIGKLVCSLLVKFQLDLWWLYIPFCILASNAVCVLLFNSHYICHAQNIFRNKLAYFWALLGLAPLWMSPTLWEIIHNQLHHNYTNGSNDPDRCYTIKEPNSWGRKLQSLGVPSRSVNTLGYLIGLGTNWGTHAFRNLIALLFSGKHPLNHTTADILVDSRTKVKVLIDYVVIAGLHLSYILLFASTPLTFLLGYLIPIWIGYGISMTYIYTNHFLCPLTEVNDTLINTTSLKVPKWLDKLHLNFSYHVEHHLFPTMNTDYYPAVRQVLIETYANKFRLFTLKEAYQFLFSTPRLHINDVELKDNKNLVVLDVDNHTWYQELQDPLSFSK